MSVSANPSAPEEKETKHLTPAQWAEVTTLYELGEVTLADLEKKFGISQSALSKGLKSRGARKGSRAHEVAAAVKRTVIAAREETTLTAEQERQQKIAETRKQHYEWARGISVLVMKSIGAAVSTGKGVETEMGNIKALRQAMATLAVGRSERFAVLNADEELGEDELPILPIEDLTEEEIAQLQASDDNDDAILAETDDGVVELAE